MSLLRRNALLAARRLPSLAEAVCCSCSGSATASGSIQAPAVAVGLAPASSAAATSSSGFGSAVGQQCRQFTSSPVARGVHIEDEPYCRQRQVIILGNRVPTMSPDTWLADNAVLIGDVDLYDKASIWYGCVLRGDLNNISVGAFSNIQDRTVIHAARSSPTGLSAATSIGNYVTVGPGSLLRSCTVQDEVVIGERCVLLEGSLVEKTAVLAPGAVVPPGRLIPSGQLWAGNPARYVRDLTKDEKAEIKPLAESVFRAMDLNKDEQMEESIAYLEAEKVRARLAAFPAYADFTKATPISEAGVIPQPNLD